jgi:glycosyltransferase involved in cell wall biosynthesis
MIYLIDLEYVETRYTSQWKTEFPALLKNNNLNVKVIEGPKDIAACTSPGAFLNFSGTNIYKAEQVKRIAELFTSNDIKDGDQFIFADAWHPGVINLKYMAELLGIDITIHGLWHAGSYDSQDFLGRLIGDADWVRNAEKSFYDCFDYNWFASEFHIDLFYNVVGLKHKSHRTGWPFEFLRDAIKIDTEKTNKRDTILFPHRLSPEKQPDIFDDIANELPEYQFIFCQKMNLNKKDYHKLLGECKIVFSANLQETLGIGCYEALCAGAIPMVPNRLSYEEMYYDEFKYDSEWTRDMDGYTKHKDEIINRIRQLMEDFHTTHIQSTIHKNREYLDEKYFSAGELIDVLLN